MPRNAETTKAKIFAAAYALLFRQGYSRTSMDSIAAAAGVTKKTLYYHFDSKDALVEALLDQQRERALAMFKGWTDPDAECPSDFVRWLFSKLLLWTENSPWYGSGFTRLTMELADMKGHPARVAAHRHKSEVEKWLANELKRLGQEKHEDVARELMLLTNSLHNTAAPAGLI